MNAERGARNGSGLLFKGRPAALLDTARQPGAHLPCGFASLLAIMSSDMKRTFDELLASGVALDGVIVSAAHHAHFDVGMKAIRAGLHVFMEKPMTTDPDEAAALADAVATSGRLFMVLAFLTPSLQ